MPISFKLFNQTNNLGGTIKGYIPQAIQTTDNGDEFAVARFILKQAWNTDYKRQTHYKKTAVTPFRAVTNSGDLLSRQNYSCGGSCQSIQSTPRVHGIKNHLGHMYSNCDGSGIPPSSCNPKYVYDSSNYTRFVKEKSIVSNYNDISYGGNEHSASQSAIKAVRRY
jgi:hypothetical protein